MSTLVRSIIFFFCYLPVGNPQKNNIPYLEKLLKAKQNEAKDPEDLRGPQNLNDAIAIVGAGASGIHMALLLKEKGYTNVTVFEKEDRIGGKSHTIYHRGTPHEMGTVYTQPDYTEVFRLVKKYDAGNLKPMPSPVAWIKTNTELVNISCQEATVLEIMKLKPDFTLAEIPNYLSKIVGKYILIHKEMFSDYIGELMPRPTSEVLEKTNKTFLEFLIAHDIEALKALFVCTQTAQGYGHIDEIPALYGLMWMTPNFLTKILTPKDPWEKDVHILDKGFQFLWEEIVRQENIVVKLNAEVERIVRYESIVRITYKEHNCRRYHADFDFLILSPTMKDIRNIIQYNDEEYKYFSKMNGNYFTTTLVDHEFVPVSSRGNSPQSYYFFNILGKQESSVWVSRDSFSSLNFITDGNYTRETFPDGKDGAQFQTSVFYQYSKEKPFENDLEYNLQEHVNFVLKTNIKKIKRRITWCYFPRFSTNDLATGILWDILQLQGKYRTWYIGSSVSFESVKSVLEYNLLLLRTIKLP